MSTEPVSPLEQSPQQPELAERVPPIASSASSAPEAPTEPPPSYVKLAMRNMVRKGGKSLFHFFLTVSALLALLVGLAYLTR